MIQDNFLAAENIILTTFIWLISTFVIMWWSLLNILFRGLKICLLSFFITLYDFTINWATWHWLKFRRSWAFLFGVFNNPREWWSLKARFTSSWFGFRLRLKHFNSWLFCKQTFSKSNLYFLIWINVGNRFNNNTINILNFLN